MYLKIATCFSPSWPPLAGPVDPRVENPIKNTVDWCMFLIGDCFANLPLILFVSLYLWHRWVQLRDDFVYNLRDFISLNYSVDIFFILTFQFVKYSMMLQWLYNHLFQAVQSMFQLIQFNRPMCNHPLQVTFLILELKFYSPRNCRLNLKKKICKNFKPWYLQF